MAYDEGLFAKEGLEIVWEDVDAGVDRTPEIHVLSPQNLNPFHSHGRLLEQGKADMYNACEWGNYCRVQDTRVGSRQVGRRGIVTYAAIVVRPNSPVYTPQQLANRSVGVPFYFGTHYLALHLLEGFVPRDMIKVCSVPHGSRYRLDMLMKGEIDATTLTEPYITLAEKKGCRIDLLRLLSRHRGRLRSAWTPRPTPPSTAPCARRCAASTRTSAHICTISSTITKPRTRRSPRLTVADLREARLVVVDPAPIPEDEMQRTYDWLKSWDMLEETASPLELVNLKVQDRAHVTA